MNEKKIPTYIQERLVTRAERLVVGEHENHIRIFPNLASIALFLSAGGDRQVFHDTRTQILEQIAGHGIEAEAYARRGDFGSGHQDSTEHLRVLRRQSLSTMTPRIPLAEYDQYSVRGSNRELINDKNQEDRNV